MTARFQSSRLQLGNLSNEIQLVTPHLHNRTRTVICHLNRLVNSGNLDITSFYLIPPCHTTLCDRMASEFDPRLSLPNRRTTVGLHPSSRLRLIAALLMASRHPHPTHSLFS